MVIVPGTLVTLVQWVGVPLAKAMASLATPKA
jgi:hypothetical protein